MKIGRMIIRMEIMMIMVIVIMIIIHTSDCNNNYRTYTYPHNVGNILVILIITMIMMIRTMVMYISSIYRFHNMKSITGYHVQCLIHNKTAKNRPKH